MVVVQEPVDIKKVEEQDQTLSEDNEVEEEEKDFNRVLMGMICQCQHIIIK